MYTYMYTYMRMNPNPNPSVNHLPSLESLLARLLPSWHHRMGPSLAFPQQLQVSRTRSLLPPTFLSTKTNELTLTLLYTPLRYTPLSCRTHPLLPTLPPSPPHSSSSPHSPHRSDITLPRSDIATPCHTPEV